MSDAAFNVLFGAEPDDPFPVDNAMLRGAFGAGGGRSDESAAAGGGACAGGSRRAPPKEYIAPETANAVLRRMPEPITDIYAIDTSCDESTDDDDGVGGSGSAAAAAAAAAACGSAPAFLDSEERRVFNYDREFDDGDGEAHALREDAAAAAAAAQRNQRTECTRRRRRRRRPPHRARNEFECFGCTVSMPGTAGASDANIDASRMHKLVQLFCASCASMTPWAVARECHAFYKSEIYEECLRRGTPVPMWHTCQIYEHFFNHVNSPHVYLLKQVSEYAQMSTMLYSMTASRVEGGSGVEAQIGIIALKLRVDERLCRLRKEDVTKYNYHNADVNVDLRHAGAYIPPHRNFRVDT